VQRPNNLSTVMAGLRPGHPRLRFVTAAEAQARRGCPAPGRTMLHVEAVIKILDPTFNLRRIVVKRREAKHGSSVPPPGRRRAQDGHRAADGAGEIAERCWRLQTSPSPQQGRVADLTGTILASLRNHDGKGVQRANEGSPARWRLSV
jgi:hypothetical protein